MRGALARREICQAHEDTRERTRGAAMKAVESSVLLIARELAREAGSEDIEPFLDEALARYHDALAALRRCKAQGRGKPDR